MGHPKRGGDPTVAEWLHEFDVARQTGVKDVDRAVALLDHLGGCAREEVLCQPERVCQDCKALVVLLLLRFGPPETVPSLSTAFHGRMQFYNESLADYSRGLMQLHNRMEQATASEAEGAAIVLLRDNALKEQFVRCVREQSVRQELRRSAPNSVDKSFHHMRDEALHILQEHDEHYRTTRVRGAEVGGEAYQDEPVPVLHTRSQDMCTPSQMMQAHRQLQAQAMQLSSQENEMGHQLQAVLERIALGHGMQPRSQYANRPSPRGGLCFFCRQKGNFIRDCPRKRDADARGMYEQERVPWSTVYSAVSGNWLPSLQWANWWRLLHLYPDKLTLQSKLAKRRVNVWELTKCCLWGTVSEISGEDSRCGY